MAGACSTTSLPGDVSGWLQAVLEYVKNDQTNILDLRSVPEGAPTRLSSRDFFPPQYPSDLEVDIQPVLDSLVGSSITELNLKNKSISYVVQNLAKILARTTLSTLCLSPLDLKGQDVLDLMQALEGTQVTDLFLSGRNVRLGLTVLANDQVDQFVAFLEKSQLKSLKLFNIQMQPLEKVSHFFESLPNTQLTRLDLTSILLSEKPDNFPELLRTLMSNLEQTSVIELTLSCNKLGDASAKVIGASLESSKLEKLDVSRNELTNFGVDFIVSGLMSSKLTHVYMDGNKIQRAFNILCHCLKDSKIKALTLSGSMFDFEKALYHRSLHTSPEAGSTSTDCTVPLTVQERSELTYLSLACDVIKVEDIPALADFISNSKVTHVDLSCNKLSSDCFSTLGECVKNSRVKFINLSSTALSLYSVEDDTIYYSSNAAITSFVDKTKDSLISLSLVHNMLISLPLENSSLVELNLSENATLNVPNLAAQLKFTNITALNLSNNMSGDKGAISLAKHLEDTQIVKLVLIRNKIKSSGAKALAEVFSKTKLRHLDLQFNDIQDDGLESIAEHAENSCLTYLNVSYNPGKRKLLVDRVPWDNRRKILRFADLLKRTALFTGDSSVFEFDRNFEGTDIDAFIDDCLKLYKLVLEEPFLVGAIEQDKHLLVLKELQWTSCNVWRPGHVDELFIENSELILQKIVDQPSPVQRAAAEKDFSFFKKQLLWLMLESFPNKFVSFICGRVEADIEERISLLWKIEDLELTRLVELLLLNRPLYVIDREQEILHPYVYKLLDKYKQPICNTDVEPDGVEKIIEYFKKHIGLQYASEVIFLLNISQLRQKQDSFVS